MQSAAWTKRKKENRKRGYGSNEFFTPSDPINSPRVRAARPREMCKNSKMFAVWRNISVGARNCLVRIRFFLSAHPPRPPLSPFPLFPLAPSISNLARSFERRPRCHRRDIRSTEKPSSPGSNLMQIDLESRHGSRISRHGSSESIIIGRASSKRRREKDGSIFLSPDFRLATTVWSLAKLSFLSLSLPFSRLVPFSSTVDPRDPIYSRLFFVYSRTAADPAGSLRRENCDIHAASRRLCDRFSLLECSLRIEV